MNSLFEKFLVAVTDLFVLILAAMLIILAWAAGKPSPYGAECDQYVVPEVTPTPPKQPD